MAGGGAPEPVRLKLRDGSEVVVRQVVPGDKAAIADGFQRMSEQSRYQRFLAVRDQLSTRELRYLTEIDHHDHEALATEELEIQTSSRRFRG